MVHPIDGTRRHEHVTRISLCPPLGIDVITSIDGVAFNEAWQNRLEVAIEGMLAIVIDRDHHPKN